MIRSSGFLLAAIFAVLGLFHIYWAAGGKSGQRVVIPNVGNKRAFNPSPLSTILVAIGLFCAMFVILGQLGTLGERVPRWIFHLGTWGISIVFFLRAVGEFKLVGFFKRVRNTEFARWDTWLFSPLCLVIATIAFALAFKSA
jgi:arginine exporter protein ArgO